MGEESSVVKPADLLADKKSMRKVVIVLVGFAAGVISWWGVTAYRNRGREVIVLPKGYTLDPQNSQSGVRAPHPIHRFTLLQGAAGGVAFDTQTGQICRTWDWKPLKDARPVEGKMPSVAVGDYSATCLSFYTQYPNAQSGQYSVVDLADDPRFTPDPPRAGASN